MKLSVLYSYTNYREFLEDVFEQRKQQTPGFSYQAFADKAGFKSKSYIKLVIDGKKNLSGESIDKLNNVLKMNDNELAYFKELVSFNQAKTLELKNYYFEKLVGRNKNGSARIILEQQYEFYTIWYHNTIREIIQHFDFQENFELLGKKVTPDISASKARKSVALLLKLGLIKRTADNRYIQSDPTITTGNEVQSLAIKNFHFENLAIAASSIETADRSSRDLSCLVVGLSEDGIAKVKDEIQLFRKKLLNWVEEEKKVSRVYHLNFQMFPTSQNIGVPDA